MKWFGLWVWFEQMAISFVSNFLSKTMLTFLLNPSDLQPVLHNSWFFSCRISFMNVWLGYMMLNLCRIVILAGCCHCHMGVARMAHVQESSQTSINVWTPSACSLAHLNLVLCLVYMCEEQRPWFLRAVLRSFVMKGKQRQELFRKSRLSLRNLLTSIRKGYVLYLVWNGVNCERYRAQRTFWLAVNC